MIHLKKRLAFGLAAGLLAACITVPVYGASRKKITSISLTIKADIEADTDYGDETIEIESSSSRYNVDGYEVMNEGFGWTEDTVPEIRIMLTANDDYYFTSLGTDKITLKGGAEFKKATRQDSSETLLLDVTLPSMQNSLKDMEGVTLSQEGSWPVIGTAGSYEVRVYRGDKIVGASLTTETNSINCRERMLKPNESYMVKVRAVNKFDPTIKGEWVSSNTIYVGNSVSAQLQVRPTSASNYATVALTSSNEKVATVNNFGRVTGIAPGTATITATCGSVTATTNVTVMSIPNSSTGTASTGSSNSGQVVTVNPSYVVLKPGATRTLTASVKPSSASQKFTYKSANSNIATVSPSGVITAVGTGATSITVSNGTASAMVTVIVNRSAASSSDNSSDSSSTESDNDTPIEIDPVVQAIQDSEDNEIVFTQAEVPTVTGDILNALRTTGKTLCVVGDGYTMQIAGSGVKSTTSELDTMLILTESDQGIEFELDKGKALPCSVRIDLDVSTYTRLYLYNAVSNKWQYLNSYTDGIITADTAGRYLLTNQNLKFANINWTFFIAGGVVVVLIGIAYVVLKKRYWFW